MSSQMLTDLMQSTAAESEIKFYFITKTGSIEEASEDLKYSFQIIADFASTTENLQWMSEADCLCFDTATLSKENVFVLEEFEGEAFDHLSTTKAIVIGPRVLINCQSSNDVVPNISSPIYTLAMKNVTVCVSGIDAEKRADIHKLVGFMGGLASKDLIESTTHLITNTIKSPKYEKAAQKNMKIMNEDWVFDVWQLSKNDDNSYTSQEFLEKHKVPIFLNLVITSTGIPEADKNEIIQLIKKNGGTYSGTFKSRDTDILITQPNQKNTEKFKAAVKCRKECLMVEWVKDSVSRGYALPYINYRVYTGQPTRGNVLNSTQITNRSLRPDIFHPDVTQLSAIISDVSIAETTSALTPMKKSSADRSDSKGLLKNIDMDLVKSAKGCLDGCIIWLCGFTGTEIDKLKKIINIGAGIRIDEPDTSLEYAIVGKPNSVEIKNLKSIENSNIVTVDWLVACINAKRIADPKDFLYKLEASHFDSIQTVPSPASRKNIEDMNPIRRTAYVPRTLNLNDDDEKTKNSNEKTLLEQYSQPPNERVNVQREQTVEDGETAEESDQIDPNLFRGLTFALFDFSEESTLELSSEIDEVGGSTVGVNDFSKIVDYLVVPGDTFDIGTCKYKAKEIVTDLWIQECLEENAIVDIKYYHRAILVKEGCKPLQGQTIVFSTYTKQERDYLYNLAQALGGQINDRYIRSQNPILICPTPEGKKYLGAIKWKLPVVTCEWLKKCLELEENVPMQNYAVFQSKCQDVENSNSGSDKSHKDCPEKTNANRKESDEDVAQDAIVTRCPTPPQDARVSSTSNIGNMITSANSPVTPHPLNTIASGDGNFKTPTTAQHPRVSSIKNIVNPLASSNSPITPLRSNTTASGDENFKTPKTIFVSDFTPKTAKIIYDVMKQTEENESPLTKRKRLENVTDSPFDMSRINPPDIFERMDRDFVEMPKRRQSLPLIEYRKRVYKEWLGDKYDENYQGNLQKNEQVNSQSSPHASRELLAQPSAVENVLEAESSTKDTEKRGGDGSTQIQEFINSIKKCRESRPFHTNTQQISRRKLNDLSPDTEEEFSNEQNQQQEEIIDYRDPDDFFQSERFLNGSRSTFKGIMRFGMSLAIDAELKEKIEKLGGTVCADSSAFDPTCTHLICSKPNQSEKTLSIIASGRWLLCPAYVEDSFTAGHFLNEGEYEWGNPKAKSNLPGELDAKSNKIAMVGHKWRKELQLKSKTENRPVGMFSGFRAIIHSSKKDSFKRLLEAGCGVVVDLKEPYTQQKDFQGITHCFVDRKMHEISDNEKAAMRKAGVHLVTILFLQACVQEDNLPSVHDYAVK